MRSVVLIIEHGDDGALGLSINRPVGLDVVDVLPDWTPYLAPPEAVFAGGPVEREMAVGLAWRPAVAPAEGWQPVLGGVGLIDLSQRPNEVAGVQRVRVFAGYAGWSPSQLELELAIGSWFVVDGSSSDPFDAVPESLWTRVLKRQKGPVAFYASYPDDVRTN